MRKAQCEQNSAAVPQKADLRPVQWAGACEHFRFGPIPDLCGAANGASELLELIAVVDEENSGRDQERASALHGQGLRTLPQSRFRCRPTLRRYEGSREKPGRDAFKKQNAVLENLASGDDSFRYSCRSRPVPHFDVFASLASAALSAARAPARMVAIE